MLMHTAERALCVALRLLLAGVLCLPLLVGLYGLTVARDLNAVGWSSTCLGDTCVWWSDGDLSLSWPPTQPCWPVYHRPC